MNIVDIIEKKRNGFKLTEKEIAYFIQGYTRGEIPDYQISALLMAIYFNNMDHEETLILTKEIINSGDVLNMAEIDGILVDKHSSGGIGDKITLILGPILTACGLKFAKMSGRGLGYTGGTLDKLESIKGFNVNLTYENFINNINKSGIAIGGQTGNITPADKKLYALRDVTATVDIIPLIAASIMSKKLAVSSDALVLDVKVGKGAFMKDLNQATALAEEMLKIGKAFGRNMKVVLSNMNQPLGQAVGNSLEVQESIDCLKGKWASDIKELTYTLATQLLLMTKVASNNGDAEKLIDDTIDSGKAFNTFKEMVKLQNGDINQIENGMDKSKHSECIISDSYGYVEKLNALNIGKASLILGAGREKIDSTIDHAAGILLNKKIGDKVLAGDTLATIFSNNPNSFVEAKKIVKEAFIINKNKINSEDIILKVIEL